MLGVLLLAVIPVTVILTVILLMGVNPVTLVSSSLGVKARANIVSPALTKTNWVKARANIVSPVN